jgi:DNA helicase-4
MINPQLIELLEKLVVFWRYWERDREYYVNEVIPQLKDASKNTGNARDRQIISEIQRVASKEDWDRLEEIAKNLEMFKAEILNITKSLTSLFNEKRYKEAESQYSVSEPKIYASVKKKYLAELEIQILSYLKAGGLAQVEQEMAIHADLLTKNERIELKKLIFEEEREIVESALSVIKKHLAIFDYEKAERDYEKIASKFLRSDFEGMLQDTRTKEAVVQQNRFVETQIEKIALLLNEYKFDEAAKIQQSITDWYRIEDYRQLENEFRLKFEKEKFLKELSIFLSKGDFRSADHLHSQSNLLSEDEYLREKSKYVITLLKQYGEDARVNEEQALAIAHSSKQLLVTARAGSGKTRLLSARALLLIDFEKVHPDHILIMSFNRDAAATVKARIRGLAKSNFSKAFENARTFHSLAHQVVQPTGKLLFDNKGEFARKEFSEFVQSIFREMLTPRNSKSIYEFFRREMASVQRSGALKDDKEYYLFIRNQRYTTLKGEKVKSIGEKFIADFLFEHGISYGYEKDYLWNNRVYRPDFSMFLNSVQYIIEHWGIDESDQSKSSPEDWERTWDDYHDEMQKKREYWKDKSNSEKKKSVLLETSVTDLKDGRTAFESILKTKLEGNGIVCKKLSEQDLIQKVYRLQIDRMTNLLVQFIFKAKKRRWSAAETMEKVTAFSTANVKTKFFLELGCQVYKAYEEKIRGKIDFDELINQAIERIQVTNGKFDISVDDGHSRYFKLSDLEWLFIDEYQDFSLLFYDLVRAIQKCNPQLKLMCVGDNWQAINSFAGSDLSYFHEFTSLFPEAKITSLSTNYRSKSVIVDGGNQLMKGLGLPAKSAYAHQGGKIFVDDMEVVKLNYKVGDTQEINPDIRFLFFDKAQNTPDKLRSNSFMVGKYLKACHNIITHEINKNKSFTILSRNNQIYGVDSRDFLAKLISSISSQDKQGNGILESGIKISTTHSFKGLEADCIIILQACQGYFPSLHPDNRLFEIFGQTDKSVLDEERRLFYVAITRARENLFILTEESRKSDFLTSFPVNPFLK